MSVNKKSISAQINLLLTHIISTFGAKLGMLWIAGSDTFYMNSLNGEPTLIETHHLNNFLASYYYRFLRSSYRTYPIILEDVFKAPNMPELLTNFAESANIKSVMISPIVRHRLIKGTLLLGANSITKLKRINSDLLMMLSDLALYLTDYEMDNDAEKNAPSSVANAFGMLIGKNKQMQIINETISKISDSDANVFIYGESGTGKELVARTLHSMSRRKSETFIPVDCVALPKNLLESELFGFEKGAFTGAYKIKRGLLEYADGGSFFLDEITEMNFDLQAKLLRVLQEKQFRRIGGKELLDVDIRIISATNRNPKEAIDNKQLRQDLYYRLNVIPIYVPPLRERAEDIPLFVIHFIKEISKSNEQASHEVTDDAMEKLINYRWPGNIRELRNVIERSLALARNDLISVADLPDEIVHNKSTHRKIEKNESLILPYNQAKKQNLLSFERSYFSKLLDKNLGNITKVAKEAKVSRKTIYNILKKHRLNIDLV